MKRIVDCQHDVVDSAIPLDFLDHLSAERGIRRGAASALLGEWLLAQHQVRRWRAMADRLARGAAAETNELEFASTTDARQDRETTHIVWIRY